MMVNCTGVLFAAILSDMGFRAGDLSIYYTIRQLLCAATIGITTRLFFQRNPRTILFITGSCCAISFWMIAFFSQVWQWYIAAVLIGFGMSCTTVVIPIVLGNWFHRFKGTVIGLTMAASGIAGALYSPISSEIIERFGWRQASVITGVIGFVMIAVGSLLFDLTPEKLGLTPYGQTSETEHGQEIVAIQQKAVPSWIFPVALFALLSVNSYTQVNNQIPTFAQAAGYSLSVGAILTSCSMVGNISGKLLTGMMTDRIGVYRSIQVILCLVLASQLLFLFGTHWVILLQIASLLYGLVYSLGTTVPALLFYDLYGRERYKGKVQISQSANYFVLSATSFIFPYIYDLTGSFPPVFAAGAGICAVSLLIIEGMRRYVKSNTLSAQ